MTTKEINEILYLLDKSVELEDGKLVINNAPKMRANIHRLAEVSALETGTKQGLARYITRMVGNELGLYPASIHELYLARGRGEIPAVFTVPAFNLRVLSFDAARAVFRAALPMNASAFIFEIARSEMGYTDQRPAEYATSILAAAIAEDYRGPIFIQGDHFQASGKRFTSDPETELQAIKDLITEALQAGFYNIDIDTSTLVDLSKSTLKEQQRLNTDLSAMFTSFIRSNEPPGVTVSIGGEIGEVGGHNSTVEELCAYMEGYLSELANYSRDTIGISKISVQTGTSHGGVVLPDGSIAKVNVDFDTLSKLSQVARQDFGLGGAVQHGASTLPEDAFGKFVESEAIEVHLATNFQNMFFDLVPEGFRSEMYAYLDQKHSSERKSDMTDEQFYYKVRKNAIGPFKKASWNLPREEKDKIGSAWERQFSKLFKFLGVSNTRKYIEDTIPPVIISPNRKFYLGATTGEEDVSDLAD